MALPEVGSASYPTPDEIKAQLLADLRYAYVTNGLTVNATKLSEADLRYGALANRLALPIANNRIAARNRSPSEAEGDDLVALASDYGVSKRPASYAAGLVIVGVSGSGSVTIPASFVCTSAAGIQYQTTGSNTVSDGDTVEVQSLTAGTAGNLDAGELVTWDSAAIGTLVATATVAVGDIGDGADEDDDEALRQRLQRRLQFPAAGGNAAQVCTWAEDASAAVEVAFCYPAVRGPGSYDICALSTDSDRLLSTATLNTIAGVVLGQMPGFADLVTTTATAEDADVVVDIDLPLPVNSGGAGGGWRDAEPWPSDAETGVDVYAEITSVANIAIRQITVNSTNADPPVAGKRFAVWNPTGGDDSLGEMHEFTIESVGGVSGAYVITIDADSDSISFLATGMLCSAGAHNIKAYAEAFRDATRTLGPGEKTDDPDILPHARRTPSPDDMYPTDITRVLLSTMRGDYTEIQEYDYAAVYDNGSGDAGTGLFTARYSPSVPATTADPPNLLTLANLSFRRRT